jgi:hypothetical protein
VPTRVGIVIVLVLLAGAAGLALLPFGAGAVRVGGLSVAWWYAALLAPSTATLVTTVVLLRRPASPDEGGEPAPPSSS